VVATIGVGNTPYGVAFLPNGTRAYVANTDDDTLSVIDTATNQVVGSSIPVGDEPEWVTVLPNGSRVYVANYESKSVSVIDTATNQVVATIPLGAEPEFLAATPNGSRVYVSTADNGGGRPRGGRLHSRRDASVRRQLHR
jgi:YVTN family beta-propeller protein